MKIPKAEQLPSGAWRCRVTVNGVTKSFVEPTEKKAITEAMAYRDGAIYESRPENITLSAAIDRYIADRSSILSPSTVRGYRTLQANRFQSIIEMPVAKISTQAVQRALNEDAKTVSPKTIKNAIGLISGVLGYYNVEIGKLTMPEQQKQEKQIYTQDQLRILLDAIRGTDIELVVLLAAWLGLRRSEILALRWDAIDYENGTLRVSEAVVPDENHKFVTKGTKTAASKRILSCPEYILDVFKRTKKEGERLVNVHPDTVRRKMEALCEKANIPYIGLHALRHQNASTMLLLNVPDKYVMERGGWSNTATPKSVYQHTMKEGRTEADKAIDNYFNSLVRNKRNYALTPGGIPKRKTPKKFRILPR